MRVSPKRALRSRQRGLSFAELMTTLAIVGVLVGMSAPGIGSMILDNRIRSQSADVQALLAVARSESAKRGSRVTICTSTSFDAATPACTTTGGTGAWANGIIAFVDVNADGTFNSGTDTLIRVLEPLSGGNTLVATGFTNNNWFQYRPSGVTNVPAAGASLKLCDSRTGAHGRTITISNTGRAVSAVATC